MKKLAKEQEEEIKKLKNEMEEMKKKVALLEQDSGKWISTDLQQQF